MFKRNDPINIPTMPGVYFLFSKRKKLVYIGKAKNLKIRLNQHKCNYQNAENYFYWKRKGITLNHIHSGIIQAKPFEYFRFTIIPDLEKVDTEETRLIYELNPMYNYRQYIFNPNPIIGWKDLIDSM